MPCGERVSALSFCAGAQTGGKCWGLNVPLPPTLHSPVKIPALIPVKPKGLSVSHPLQNLIVSSSRCLPRGWVRSEIKGGKERSLCSQSPCSQALVVTELPWVLTPWSWKAGKCPQSGSTTLRVCFTSLMHHSQSGSGDGCPPALYEFWLFLLQLLTYNQV